MKFVCNNCGFAADIPVKRSTCPMCGSSNVSYSDEAVNLEEQVESEENTQTKKIRQPQGPTQRVTLTDGLNPAKQETAKKETKPADCKKSKLPLIIGGIAVLAVIAALFFLL